MGETPILSIEKIDASYGPVQAIRQVSIEVMRGEIVTLIGANGAGKSTLLMSIFGKPRISAGSIRFRGLEISQLKTHEIARHGISLVPEGRRIFPRMTVEENLILGAGPDANANVSEGIEKAFQMFPRLKERREQRAGTMSGGEQQMLAISRALMSRPELLLLDEPSLGLAPLIVQQIFDTLQTIAASGTTVFLVEQNAAKALKFAQRGYVMVTGEIILQGTGAELLANSDVQAAYLGQI